MMSSADHVLFNPDLLIREQEHNKGDIIIEEDCWIGGHVSITRNVTIGKGIVIGANSVVTRDIPPYSVAGGTPARILKNVVINVDLRCIVIFKVHKIL